MCVLAQGTVLPTVPTVEEPGSPGESDASPAPCRALQSTGWVPTVAEIVIRLLPAPILETKLVFCCEVLTSFESCLFFFFFWKAVLVTDQQNSEC